MLLERCTREDGSVELHKSAGLRDRGVKKDQDHRDRDRDRNRDRDRLSRSKRKPANEMIGFSVPRKARTGLLLRSGPPVATIPQLGNYNSFEGFCTAGHTSINSSKEPVVSTKALKVI
ncbi:unnamed protein product [Camellia sinensis]